MEKNYVCIYVCFQWFIQTIQCIGCHQSDAANKRIWSAGIVMALVVILEKAKVQSAFNIGAFKVMFTYLCLEKNQCEYIVSLLETSLRLVVHV